MGERGKGVKRTRRSEERKRREKDGRERRGVNLGKMAEIGKGGQKMGSFSGPTPKIVLV